MRQMSHGPRRPSRANAAGHREGIASPSPSALAFLRSWLFAVGFCWCSGCGPAEAPHARPAPDSLVSPTESSNETSAIGEGERDGGPVLPSIAERHACESDEE